MAKPSADTVAAFEDFWERIRSAENQIRDKGYGLMMEGLAVDPWQREERDEQLLESYAMIRDALEPVSFPGLYPSQVAIPWAGPFRAENAHQAVMYHVNPIAFFMGAVDALRSPEYLEAKELAYVEMEALEITRIKIRKVPVQIKKTAKPRGLKLAEITREKVVEALARYHREKDPERSRPITQVELGKYIGLSQTGVSNFINKHFQTEWSTYVASFRSDNDRRGHVNRDGEGGRFVDATVEPSEEARSAFR